MISSDTKKIIHQQVQENKKSISVLQEELDGIEPRIVSLTSRRDQLRIQIADLTKSVQNMKKDIGDTSV